jgi:hypothetical protein
MVLAVVTEMPLQLQPVEPDPFLDPLAVDVTPDHGVADAAATGEDERLLTRHLTGEITLT